MKGVLTFLTGFFLMIGSVISGKYLIKQKTLIPSMIPSITASPTISPTITDVNQQPTNISFTSSPQQIKEIEEVIEIEDISAIETDVDDLPDFNVEFSLE